jgi:hypothetical protein
MKIPLDWIRYSPLTVQKWLAIYGGNQGASRERHMLAFIGVVGGIRVA